MKVFIDTNVILEYLMQRERISDAEIVLDYLQSDIHDMYMSVGGFYTILYCFDKFLRKDMNMEKIERVSNLRVLLTRLLDVFLIAEHDNQSLLRSISDVHFIDLEDSCQYQAAERAGCEFLITFNIDDYRYAEGGVRVVTPKEFMQILR